MDVKSLSDVPPILTRNSFDCVDGFFTDQPTLYDPITYLPILPRNSFDGLLTDQPMILILTNVARDGTCTGDRSLNML